MFILFLKRQVNPILVIENTIQIFDKEIACFSRPEGSIISFQITRHSSISKGINNLFSCNRHGLTFHLNDFLRLHANLVKDKTLRNNPIRFINIRLNFWTLCRKNKCIKTRLLKSYY